jgi:phosphatidylserine/phosphatidylglycerophosphate/cardiolipin synthase-like enzyme
MAIKSIRWVEGHKSSEIAAALADFVSAAKKSVDIAIYDFRLSDDDPDRATVVDAIKNAAKKCAVRLAFDDTKSSDTTATGKATIGSDPAPRGTKEFVQAAFPESTKVKTVAIAGSHLMHSKYIVRDGQDIWTGSANFTHDAWSAQENNVVQLSSKELAAHYEADFTQLWTTRDIKGTGKDDYGSVTIDGSEVEFGFAPGSGSAVASLFVDGIQGAGKTQVHLATMILSSGPILGALIDHLHGGGTVSGVYDATQMAGVEDDWKKYPTTSGTKLAQWNVVKPHLRGKHSQPYTDGGVHDFMHDKILATEKVVITGSFNLSRNAESNAENALAFHDPALAAQYVGYIEGIRFPKK